MRHGYVAASFSLLIGLSAAVVGLPPLVGAQGVTRLAADTSATFQTKVGVTGATSVRPGQTALISASISSTAQTTASVDVEIYDSTGTLMFEYAQDAQDFAANSPRTYTFGWAVPTTAAAGTYSIQTGLFSADWSTQYAWDESAGSLVVLSAGASGAGAGAASTRTPTPRPVGATSTPTPRATSTPTPRATVRATSTPRSRNPQATATSVPRATSTPVVKATSTPVRSATSPPASRPSAGAAVGGLHVVGNQIQNSTGAAVQLVGVNRSSAEYACVSDGGYAVFEGPVDQASVTAMRSWRINAVRVVLNEDCWLGINGVNPQYSGKPYQDAVTAYVDLLAANNIASIINLHFSAPGSELAVEQEPMADRDHSPAFWQSVGAHFKDRGSVLFEPYNEPYPDNGNNTTEAWRCWRDGGTCAGVPFTAAGMQELVAAIRAGGAHNVIILTGNNWGSQLDGWLASKPVDPLNQLAAGWHSYGDGLDCQTESCWNSLVASVMAQVPVVATEIGEFDCQHSYIDRVMKFLDSHGAGYQTWAWGPYDCSREPGLLVDWAGTPTDSYGQGFRDHLLQLP